MKVCELPDGQWQVCRWEEEKYYPSVEWVACPDCADEDQFPEPESWIEYEDPEEGFSCEHCGLRVVDGNDFFEDEF